MMTKNNSKKKLVRARMTQTGEPYSVANRKLDTRKPPLFSPWGNVNILIGGFQPGQVYVMKSRPGQGKTMFGLNLLTHFALNKNFCFYVNMELSRPEIIQRVVSNLTGVPHGNYNREDYSNFFTDAEKDAKRELTGSLVVYEKGNRLTIETISENLRANGDEIKVAIIDGMNLLHFGATVADRNAVMKQIKELAVELGIPIILFGSLTRNAWFSDNFNQSPHADTNFVIEAFTSNVMSIHKLDDRNKSVDHANLILEHEICKLTEPV